MAKSAIPSATRQAARQRGRVVGALLPFFDSDIAERGVNCYRRGAVEVTQWTDRTLIARVNGTASYSTGVHCAGTGPHQSVGLWCNCPYVTSVNRPCKHLWAVIQVADALGALGALNHSRLYKVHLDVEPGEFLARTQSVAEPGAPETVPPGAQQGIPSLARRAVPASSSNTTQLATSSRLSSGPAELLCSLDPELVRSSGQLSMSVWLRPRGGSYERCERLRARATELRATDRWLFETLEGSRQASGRHPLMRSPREVQQFFMRLCKAQRLVYWPAGELRGPDLAQPLSFDVGAPWRLRLVGHPLAGDLLVHGELIRSKHRKHEVRPLCDASLLLYSGVVGFPERLGKLLIPDEETWSWIQKLRRAPQVEIPAESVEAFLDEHLEAERGPELVLPDEFRFERVTTKPQPWLLLRFPEHGQQVWGRLELQYGSRRVSVPHHPPVVVDVAERRMHVHEPGTEHRLAKRLLAIGFQGAGHPDDAHEPMPLPDGTLVNISATEAPDAIARLVRAGWSVTVNGKPHRRVSRFTGRISTGLDWFELRGGLELDGQTLGMPELLRAARRGERLVDLKDGSVAMLPAALLTRLGMLGSRELNDDAVVVPRSQLIVLDELASTEMDLTVDAAFDRLRDELSTFQALQPVDPPAGFRGELRDYQRLGLAWMQLLGRLGFGGCLADDMGLGKTVQVLALLLGRDRRRRRLPPSLVVAPSSVVFNWVEEARRFAPTLCVVAHAGSSRGPLEVAVDSADLIVTSYALLRREAAAFAAAQFDYVILDEAQAIKNDETETAKVARALKAATRLTMTGTPIENHLGELASQLEFLNPGIIGSSPRLSRAILSGRADAESLKLVRRTVHPFLLRRTKQQVARELPERIEKNVFVELRGRERKRYDQLHVHYKRRIEQQVAKVGVARSAPQVLEALLRLRQAACHPGLLDERHRAERSAKLDRLMEELERIRELGERCLVFSQFTSFLGIVRQQLDAQGIRYEYLDGASRHRQQIVERFQRPDGAGVFLISLLAGGVGLNLTAAEHVLLLDPWWNPAVEAQAIDRSHRIGQTRTVLAYRLIARGTVEEKVLLLQQEKRALAQAILGEDSSGFGGKLTREDLEALLG